MAAWKKILLACAAVGLSLISAWSAAAAPFPAESGAPVLSPFAASEDGTFSLGSRAAVSVDGGEFFDRNDDSPNLRAFSAGLSYRLSGGLFLRGSYIMEDVPAWYLPEGGSESPNAWTAGIGLTQDSLGFTSFAVEYERMGAGFRLPGNSGVYANNFYAPLSGPRHGFTFNDDAGALFLSARQRWNSRFSTFLQYSRYYSYEEEQNPHVRQWSVGMGYQYSPGVYMEVVYDDQSGALDSDNYTDKRVRLRTMINF